MQMPRLGMRSVLDWLCISWLFVTPWCDTMAAAWSALDFERLLPSSYSQACEHMCLLRV